MDHVIQLYCPMSIAIIMAAFTIYHSVTNKKEPVPNQVAHPICSDSSTETTCPERSADFIPGPNASSLPIPKKSDSAGKVSGSLFIKVLCVILVVFALCVAVSVGITWSKGDSVEQSKSGSTVQTVDSTADEADIKKQIRESQLWEVLKAGEKPSVTDFRKAEDFWVPLDMGGKDIEKVLDGIRHLQDRHEHYGKESRNILLQFLSVDIGPIRDYAEARTRERWFLPAYHSDNTRVAEADAYMGPYEVDYVLRKIGHKWLVQSSSTPRNLDQ